LQISQGYIIRILQHFATKLWNITNFVMLFHAMMEFCLDLLISKFWLIGEWSIRDMKRLSRMSKSASEVHVAVERILKSEGEI
jgi:valyl-tRNA synthetase